LNFRHSGASRNLEKQVRHPPSGFRLAPE
jgi:hypothetical protein